MASEQVEYPFPNGFPAVIRKGNKAKRLYRTLDWWMVVHCGNTGYSKGNRKRLVKEILEIMKG